MIRGSSPGQGATQFRLDLATRRGQDLADPRVQERLASDDALLSAVEALADVLRSVGDAIVIQKAHFEAAGMKVTQVSRLGDAVRRIGEQDFRS